MDASEIEDESQVIILLTEIRDLLNIIAGPGEQSDDQPIIVHESKASCPGCDMTQVDLHDTDNGHVMYHCQNCETVWVNDAEALSK